jgi:hypothetical protein
MKELLEQFKTLYEMMASSELSDAIATMYWNIYQALIEKGFTENQALEIVVKFQLNSK